VRLRIDPASADAPFEQLRAQVAGAVRSGELAAGAKLATVRQLAEDLGLAVNTVARAYRELEADGVIVTQGRRGTFVASRVLGGQQDGAVEVPLRAYVDAVRRAGLTLDEATRLLERGWTR
jgi:DNA-binding transcriptional regulator YhcF (GntR family)